mgnify:CR=1 FL=1
MSDDRKLNLDPNKYNFTEKETRVLLEDIKSDFKVFGDGLQSIRRVQEEHTIKIDGLQEQVAKLTVDMEWVKEQIVDIKSRLEKDFVTKVEFEEIKKRVDQLELMIKSA